MLEQAIKGCRQCPMRKGCGDASPVPGVGNKSASLAIIGQNPGKEEGLKGEPFVGDAGKFLNSLLRPLGLERKDIYISNALKCLTFNNNTPTPAQVMVCASRWLDKELKAVNPSIIVTLGWPATHYITKLDDTMEHLHGRPIEQDGRVVLPAYHPAAGFHNTALLRHIYDDFAVLGKLLQGATADSLLVKDKYPNPRYEVLENPKLIRELLHEPRYALDTEQRTTGELWSMQVSVKAGEAYFIPAVALPPHTPPLGPPSESLAPPHAIVLPPTSEVTVHNYLHEAKFLDIPNFICTQVVAYLLGYPQGLKELASRLCGMKMQSYTEVVRPYRRAKALRYLEGALRYEWEKPEPYDIWEWSERLGKPVVRLLKPPHIKHKMKYRIERAGEDPLYDPYAKWFEVPAQERAEMESVLGVMPDADLSDAPFDQAVQYASMDPDATLRVRDIMMPLIREQGLEYILRCVDLPILPMVRYMMDRGSVVDLEYLKQLSGEYFEKMERTAEKCARIAGHPFNPNSSPQVAKVVYKELGFKPTKYTETEQVSTLDQELKKVNHPVVEPILAYRGALKLKSTYADALAELAVSDERGEPRVHTELLVTRTETGRLASKEPNLQNQPIRTEDGRKIRKAFVALHGGILVAPDYSGQEMRVCAHVSQDPAMLEVFRRGGDLHAETAADVYGISLERAKEWKYRYPIKRAGFGVIYLIGEQGLYDIFIEEGIEGWTVTDCLQLISDWYRRFPMVKELQQEVAAFAKRRGYIVDMFGRRRWVPEAACPIKKVRAAGERQAGNMVVQSPSATITKLGMRKTWRGLDAWGGRLLPDLQVHDELLFELLDPPLLMDVARWLKREMESVVELSVPLVVDVKAGESWGDMVELEL